MRLSTAFLILATALVLSACAPEPAVRAVDITAEEQAIRAISAEWLEFARQRDAAGIAALFAEGDIVTKEDIESIHNIAKSDKGITVGNGLRATLDIGFNPFGANFFKQIRISHNKDLVGLTLIFGQGRYIWQKDQEQINTYINKLQSSEATHEDQNLLTSFDQILSTFKFIEQTKSKVPKLPVIQLRHNGKVYDGEIGSHCWPIAGVLPEEGITTLCADYAFPNPSNVISVSLGDTLIVEINADEQPLGLSASIFTSADDLTPRKITLTPSIKSEFKVDFPQGTYTVSIFGNWTEGDIFYSFKVGVK